MNNLFYPNSIALVGVSQIKYPKGFMLLTNILSSNYTGEFFLVDSSLKHIVGIPCFERVADLPLSVDIAFVSVPRSRVLNVVEELGKKRTKNVVILTGGFGEGDDQGKLNQHKLFQLVKQYAIRIVGPNSIGLMTNNTEGKAFQGILTPQKPLYGGVSLVSQSGSVITSCVEKGYKHNLGFQKLVHIGNQVDVDLVEMLEVLEKDAKTAVIGVYVESIKKPMELVQILSRIKKPIIFLRPGVSKTTKHAIVNHTSSHSTSNLYGFYTLLDDLNVVRTESLEEFFGCLDLFSQYTTMSTFGVAVLTNGGGIGVLASEVLDGKTLPIANLQSKTTDALKNLSSLLTITNPVDLGEEATEHEYEQALKVLLNEKYVSGVIVSVLPYQTTPLAGIVESLKAVSKKHPQKPVMMILPAVCHKNISQELDSTKVPFSDSIEIAVQAMDKLYKFFNQEKNPKIWERPTKYLQKKQIDEVEKVFNQNKKNGNVKLDYVSTQVLAERFGLMLPKYVELDEQEESLKTGIKQLSGPMLVKVLRQEGRMELGVREVFAPVCKEREIVKILKKTHGKVILEELSGIDLELGVEIVEDRQFGKFIKLGLAEKYQGIAERNIWISVPCSKTRISKVLRDKGYSDYLTERVGEEGLRRVSDVLYKLMFFVVSFEDQILKVDVDSLRVSKDKVVLADLGIYLKTR
jgi:acetyltransferase